jgi:LysM repeat protein
MSRWFILLFFTVVSGNLLFAQQSNLKVRGTGANIFIEHVVTPKENFFSVGRMFNVSSRELAAFNHLKMESGLKIGAVLKIPLSENNFTQTGDKSKTEAIVPVYHAIESGETLYRLSVKYNKVPMASLKNWNHLQSNELAVGAPIIIGFLKVDKAQSSLAKRGFEPAAQVAEIPKKNIIPEERKADQPAVASPVIKKPGPDKTENNLAATEKTTENTIRIAPANANGSGNFSGSYFVSLYNSQNQNKSSVDKNGLAGVFKSTSGWQDGKYYCFNNDVSAGTVLKITNNSTGKSVYAKVLDAIPDIKQNEGLFVVLSNAAADALGAGDNKFDCVVSYGK